jgi:hypothetical protein
MATWPNSAVWPTVGEWPSGKAWPSGVAPYRPWIDEPGCVLWMAADDAGVATTSASVVDKDDFTTGNWTKTGVNVTPDSSGVYDLLTASATTATTQQVPSNHSTGTMTVTVTADVIRVADDWVCIELFPTGRAWFNINTGAVGTLSNVSATIAPLGGGAFRLSVTSVFGVNYVMLRSAGADNTLTCTIGHSFLASNVTIDQTRVSAFLNMVSAVSWEQASANLQPRYNPIGLNGRPTIEFGGQQSIISSEAAVVAALAGDDPPFTWICVHKLASADLTGCILGGGNSGVATNRTVILGQSGTGAGFYLYQRLDDAGVSNSWDVLASPDTSAHMVMARSSNGQQVFFALDGGAEVGETSALVGAVTINRVAIGQRPDSTPDTSFSGSISSVALFNVNLDAAALARILAYCQTKWGTP